MVVSSQACSEEKPALALGGRSVAGVTAVGSSDGQMRGDPVPSYVSLLTSTSSLITLVTNGGPRSLPALEPQGHSCTEDKALRLPRMCRSVSGGFHFESSTGLD